MSPSVRTRLIVVATAVCALLGAPLGQASTARAQEAPVELTVMSFNIWVGGTRVDFEKVVDAVEAADADIVGIQESGGSLERLADALGFYHHPGQQVISRYPLFEPDGGDGTYLYAMIAPRRAVVVSNVHLRAYPYGPYDLRDGATVEAVLANEQYHMEEMATRFQTLPALADRGMPVFLTGDFNAPSHLDWTDAARDRHFGLVVEWPVSAELERLGFRDTYRERHPDPVDSPAFTWTPGYPPPMVEPGEVHDRIDFVYGAGPSVTTASAVIGEGGPYTDVAVEPWPSDHRAVASTFEVEPAEVPHGVSTDADTYVRGAPITASFVGDGDPADWVGIYGEGDTPEEDASLFWKYVGGSQTPGEGVASGSVTFSAEDPGAQAGTWPPESGRYRILLLAAGGYEILAESTFTVLAEDETPAVTTDRPVYGLGEPIEVTFANGTGDPQSWVGVYPAGTAPGSVGSLRWSYVDGRTDGTVTLDTDSAGTTWPLPIGDYDVHLFADGGYTSIASTTVTVLEDAVSPYVAVDREDHASGEPIEVAFANGTGDPSSWVGLYPAGVVPGSIASLRWSYVDGRTDGRVTLDAASAGTTWPLPAGDYEVHLFADGGYTVIASTRLTVEPGGPFDAITDASVDWSRRTYPDASVARVLLARNDVYADSLASSALQGMQGGAPLLLTASDALSAGVRSEIQRLGAGEVIILGDAKAIAPAVEEELVGAGLTVRRLGGRTRVETAVLIARELPEGNVALLARAFPSPDDDSSGFADILAAGGMAADLGVPVLFTQPDGLSGATERYLGDAGIERVWVLGGTGAVPDAVLARLHARGIQAERIAGPNRAATAVALADRRGFDQQNPAQSVILAEGQGADAWASGLPAAGYSARNDAPILLTAGETLPGETRDFVDDATTEDAHVECAPLVDAAACALASSP